jgi:A/G-specific adenine glycosylase
VVDEYGGQVPGTVAELQALPGVGPYTARAVAALAFGVPVGAVDVNVRRVLGRIVASDPTELSSSHLQSIADASVPADRAGEWTHALMDVGATLCRPRAPRCKACPARPWCRLASKQPVQAGALGAGLRTAAAPTRAVREPAAPFTSTTRWLRGRILDRLRAAPDGEWVALDAAIGTHDPVRVRAAADAMAADGVLELRGIHDHDDRLHARLPLA